MDGEMLEKVSGSGYMAVSHFVEWLEESGYELRRWTIRRGHPNHADPLKVLNMMTAVNEHFEVDTELLERERRALLRQQRRSNTDE